MKLRISFQTFNGVLVCSGRYPTWKADENNGESAAMVVDYIRVYKMTADDV